MSVHVSSSSSFDGSGPPSGHSDGKGRNETADAPTKKSFECICSFVVIYTLLFFNGCCFTAVSPSVPFYLEYLNAPSKFLGWVVSSYSLGFPNEAIDHFGGTDGVAPRRGRRGGVARTGGGRVRLDQRGTASRFGVGLPGCLQIGGLAGRS